MRGKKADLVDLEHWRSFVRVDPVGPGGFKPSGQGKAALLSYVGNNHTSGRRVIGAELTRHQAENLCAAIMACFEEPEPSQEEFLHEPEAEASPGPLKRFIVLVGSSYYPSGWDDFEGSYETLDAAKAAADAAMDDEDRGCGAAWAQVIDATTSESVAEREQYGDWRRVETTHEPEEERDEPYWRKSFTVTPPPEGLEGGLAETAVVVQARHGGPVPMTKEQAGEFAEALGEAIGAGQARVRVPCGECEGSGWFSPTPARGDGWVCKACDGEGRHDPR